MYRTHKNSVNCKMRCLLSFKKHSLLKRDEKTGYRKQKLVIRSPRRQKDSKLILSAMFKNYGSTCSPARALYYKRCSSKCMYCHMQRHLLYSTVSKNRHYANPKVKRQGKFVMH